jgi:hypothetical protein
MKRNQPKTADSHQPAPIESSVDELMHIHPPPPHAPTTGIDFHPTLEPVEGPTEASDNKDHIPAVEATE